FLLAFVLPFVWGLLYSDELVPSGESPTSLEENAKLTPDLDLVPREGFGFVSMRVADLFAGDDNQALRSRLRREEAGSEFLTYLGDVLKLLDLTVSDIERATLVQHDGSDSAGSTVLIVATRRPYGRANAPVVRVCQVEGRDRLPMAEGPEGAGLL